MPTETVKVQGKADPEINPKTGKPKARGRIKSDTGKLFQAIPEILAKVEVGSTYEIDYTDETFNETKYRVVQKIKELNNRSAPVKSAETFNARSSGSHSLVKSPGGTDYITAPTEGRRSEDIATLAIVKEWMGRIPVGDVGAAVHALKSARAAWLKFKAGGDDKIESGPSLRDEMEDEINF